MEANERERRQRRRLETLADVIYGVAIVLLVVGLPTPRTEGFEGTSLVAFLAEYYEPILGSAVGLFLVVTYWIQNNAVAGVLSHTDNRHSTLMLAQLILMLGYFYSTTLSEELDHPPGVLAVQSGALALMGIVGIADRPSHHQVI